MDTKQGNSFDATSAQRWQNLAIQQRGAASSTLMAMSGGALAFTVSQLSPDKGEVLGYIGYWPAFLFQAHALFQLLSLAFGISFLLNRLADFRLTAQIARARNSGQSHALLDPARKHSDLLGKRTLQLFLWQCITFLAGTIAFVVFSYLRLWPALYAH